mgnify:CR=1 FL=1
MMERRRGHKSQSLGNLSFMDATSGTQKERKSFPTARRPVRCITRGRVLNSCIHTPIAAGLFCKCTFPSSSSWVLPSLWDCSCEDETTRVEGAAVKEGRRTIRTTQRCCAAMLSRPPKCRTPSVKTQAAGGRKGVQERGRKGRERTISLRTGSQRRKTTQRQQQIHASNWVRYIALRSTAAPLLWDTVGRATTPNSFFLKSRVQHDGAFIHRCV